MSAMDPIIIKPGEVSALSLSLRLEWEGYHFLDDNMRTLHGESYAWHLGETRYVHGTPRLCEWGYHASRTWHGCLRQLGGPIACKVLTTQPIDSDLHKWTASARKLVSCHNALEAMILWIWDMADEALRVIDHCVELGTDGKPMKNPWPITDEVREIVAQRRSLNGYPFNNSGWGGLDKLILAANAVTTSNNSYIRGGHVYLSEVLEDAREGYVQLMLGAEHHLRYWPREGAVESFYDPKRWANERFDDRIEALFKETPCPTGS